MLPEVSFLEPFHQESDMNAVVALFGEGKDLDALQMGMRPAGAGVYL